METERYELTSRIFYYFFQLICLSIFLCSPVFAEQKVSATELKYSEEDLKLSVAKAVEEKFKKLENQGSVDFARELLKKENDLKIKEFELQKQNDILTNNKVDLEKKLAEFQQRQQQLINCLDENDKNSKARLLHMVEVLGKMRPANAAALLAVQEPVLSVQLLGMLDSSQVSKIFNQMDQTIGARLQKMYLEMKK